MHKTIILDGPKKREAYKVRSQKVKFALYRSPFPINYFKLMNPLDIILEWFSHQEKEYKLELIAQVAHFHPDESLMHERDDDNRIKRFESYLDPSNLPVKEVVTRTFIMKGLIDFCLAGKDTLFDWEEKKNENLAALEEFRKQGFSDNPASEFLRNYAKISNTWMEWASDWHVTNEVSLSGDGLREWYMDFLEAPNLY